MYIQKEDKATIKTQKAKFLQDDVKKKETKKDKKLQGLSYKEQVQKLQTGAGSAPIVEQKSAVAELRALFRSMDLPETLVPNNVEKFDFSLAGGRLTIHLKQGFKVRFNEKDELTFDKIITGNLQKGLFSNIRGIKNGDSPITEISRNNPKVFDMKGKIGTVYKTFKFADGNVPEMP